MFEFELVRVGCLGPSVFPQRCHESSLQGLAPEANRCQISLVTFATEFEAISPHSRLLWLKRASSCIEQHLGSMALFWTLW